MPIIIPLYLKYLKKYHAKAIAIILNTLISTTKPVVLIRLMSTLKDLHSNLFTSEAENRELENLITKK